MARLIDADALIAEYDRVHIGQAGGARKLMVDAPTVDAVEVVRCKDCKRRDPEDKRCDSSMGMGRGIFIVNDNDYCSYGERKVSE